MAITGSTQITALELALEQALTEWLPGQRWFAGKGRPITGLEITADTELAAGEHGEPALRHLIVAVSQDGPVPGPGHPPLPGGTDSYQVLIGLREDLPGWLEHVRIGVIPDGRVAYDALYDHELAGLLLRAIAVQRAIGPVRFARVPGLRSGAGPLDRLARAPGQARAPGADLDSLVLTGEQSNTSLVYGEEAILKVFRRVAPGPNPELEVSAALGRLGSEHIAEPFGWIETCHGGEVTILAILSRYLRAASDGWSLAATSVRDLYALPGTRAAEAGGDFAPEARRLGAATAEVHEDLVRAFGSAELPGGAAGLAGPMRHRLEIALATVPALREYEAPLTAAYAELARLDGPVPVQRIHGDYHLGQVMRTQTGWVVLDFEGEPAVPLAARLAMSSPLRDVAGMLRSFDYAARHQLLGHRDRAALELLARDWVRRSREAFCAGYAEAGGQARAPGADPRESGVLLRAFELDKAVYEVVYEASNRPSWLPIPLDSLAALPATERDTP